MLAHLRSVLVATGALTPRDERPATQGLALDTCTQADLERWMVTGLLLILYAQKISTIGRLTVDDVNITGETAAITFGTSPVVLPTPLATLVRELLANR
ncbi:MULTISPECIES: hypothetical protein [unclassified Streptomyces]|uniref:hypothetical protein n=1 Tax=unclassified Streptomyces TaxID=2593676 RepID=UPI0034417D81